MRILMFGWEFPPHITGGLGTACHGITLALSGIANRSIRFVIPKTLNGEDAAFLDLVGLPALPVARMLENGGPALCAVPSGRQAAQLSLPDLPQPYGGNLLPAALGYANRVQHWLKPGMHADVIHAHDWLTVLAGVKAKEITGRPLVFHIHSTEHDRCGDNADPQVVQIERQGMEAADAIIAVSERTRQQIIQRYGQAAHKVHTVYNGIASTTGLPAGERRFISYIGRVTYQKGPAIFVEAASLALRRKPGLQFILAGDGDLLECVKARAQALGIEGSILFPGFLDGDEVSSLLEQSIAYVMPSTSEPFGIGALEAVDRGAPLIVAAHAGVAEVIDYAIKVDHTDAPAIADAMVQLADDHDFARQMALGAKRELSGLTWDRCAAAIDDIYATLLGSKALSRNDATAR